MSDGPSTHPEQGVYDESFTLGDKSCCTKQAVRPDIHVVANSYSSIADRVVGR